MLKKSIKTVLYFFFLLLTVFIASMYFIFSKFNNNTRSLHKVSALLTELNINVKCISNKEKDFIIYSLKDTLFYKEKYSIHLKEREAHIEKYNSINREINAYQLLLQKNTLLDKISKTIDEKNTNFNKLLKEILKRGYGNYGMCGELNNNIRKLEKIIPNEIAIDVKNLNLYSLSYVITNNVYYANKYNKTISKIEEYIIKSNPTDKKLTKTIENCKNIFSQIVVYDIKIGSEQIGGLLNDVFRLSNNIDTFVKQLNFELSLKINKIQEKTYIEFLFIFLLMGIVLITFSIYIYRFIAIPIMKLSNNINVINIDNIAEIDFNMQHKAVNEIGQLYTVIKNLFAKLNAYVQHIKSQKESLLEANEELLSRTQTIEQQWIMLDKINKQLKKSNNRIKSMNSELNNQNEEVKRQNNALNNLSKKLENKHNTLTSSIYYAETIQRATLPSPESINAVLENFIIYKPMQIVSGDFYWFRNKTFKSSDKCEKIYIAAVDCTGHGVPGGFMSMLGGRILNEIINLNKVYNPAEILTMLNNRIKTVLKQEQTSNDDGMDVCLCMLEKINDYQTKLTYSNAQRPLYIYLKQKKKLITLEKTLRTIGGVDYNLPDVQFENQEIIVNKGDILYLTTDGYTTQPNLKRKMFTTKRLLNLIEEIAEIPLEKQKRILEEKFDEFHFGTPMRDDVTLIGVRI